MSCQVCVGFRNIKKEGKAQCCRVFTELSLGSENGVWSENWADRRWSSVCCLVDCSLQSLVTIIALFRLRTNKLLVCRRNNNSYNRLRGGGRLLGGRGGVFHIATPALSFTTSQLLRALAGLSVCDLPQLDAPLTRQRADTVEALEGGDVDKNDKRLLYRFPLMEVFWRVDALPIIEF